MALGPLQQAEAMLLELAGRANFPETRGALLRAARALFWEPRGGENKKDDGAALVAIADMIARGIPRSAAIRTTAHRMRLSNSDKTRLRKKMRSDIAAHDKP